MENRTVTMEIITTSNNNSSATFASNLEPIGKSANQTSGMHYSVIKPLDVSYSPNLNNASDDVMNVTDQSTPIFGTKMEEGGGATFDTTYIAALVCFVVGAIVLTLAFVRLGVWVHRFRRKKEHEKSWARQMEHKRHLDDYSVKTEMMSQSVVSSESQEEEKSEKDSSSEEEEHDGTPTENTDETPQNNRDSDKVQIPKTEIEAIIGTVESRQSVRRSFYGMERMTLPANGGGLSTPGSRRSFYMNMNSGTLQY